MKGRQRSIVSFGAASAAVWLLLVIGSIFAPSAVVLVESLALFSSSEQRQRRPCLALITERGACDSEEALIHQLTALQAAIATQRVDLVSVRIDTTSPHERVVFLIQQLLQCSTTSNNNNTRIVVSSDWIQAAVEAQAHGVHVKETHRHLIPHIRSLYQTAGLTVPIIGTSTHSVESALEAAINYQPNYFFCGTCYYSESHPEKGLDQLEGPELPGQVWKALKQYSTSTPPPVLAIGGIDATNCHVPIQHGASGVASIRGVLQSPDPVQSVYEICQNMEEVFRIRQEQQQQSNK